MPKGIQCLRFTKHSVEKTYKAHKVGTSVYSDRGMGTPRGPEPHWCKGGPGVSTGCGEEKELRFPCTTIRFFQEKPRSACSSCPVCGDLRLSLGVFKAGKDTGPNGIGSMTAPSNDREASLRLSRRLWDSLSTGPAGELGTAKGRPGQGPGSVQPWDAPRS